MTHANNAPCKRVCLVDFRLTGHHPFYLANFANTFLQIGCEVDIYVGDANKGKEELASALPDLDLDCLQIYHTEAAQMTTRKWGCRSYHRLVQLQKEIDTHSREIGREYDLVFFAYLEDVTQWDFFLPYALQRPFKTRFSGLLMAPRTCLLERSDSLLGFLTATWLTTRGAQYEEIGLLVEDVVPEVESKIKHKAVVYPDFCSDEPLHAIDCPINREIAKRKNQRVITSLIGSILPHKSIDLFLQCVKAADPTKHVFVLAGKINRIRFNPEQLSEIDKIKENPPENLMIFDERLESEAVFDSIVQQSNYLFTYYRNFKKSSNLLTKSAFYGVPVISSDQHLMASRVKKYQLGLALNEEQTIDFYRQSIPRELPFDESLRKQYVNMHSVSRLKDVFTRLLD